MCNDYQISLIMLGLKWFWWVQYPALLLPWHLLLFVVLLWLYSRILNTTLQLKTKTQREIMIIMWISTVHFSPILSTVIRCAITIIFTVIESWQLKLSCDLTQRSACNSFQTVRWIQLFIIRIFVFRQILGNNIVFFTFSLSCTEFYSWHNVVWSL